MVGDGVQDCVGSFMGCLDCSSANGAVQEFAAAFGGFGVKQLEENLYDW